MVASELVADSVGASAYRQIRGDILSGQLAPGLRLRLERLKETYGVSIATLREILNRLSSERLVVAEEQRGFLVAPISMSQMREMADLRLLLEGAALESSFQSGDLEWEGRVVSAHHKLRLVEERMLDGDGARSEIWKQYDWEFHEALASACESRSLMEVYQSVYEKYLRYLFVSVPFRGKPVSDEHRTLFECALRRDIGEAKRVLGRHINDCVAFAVAQGCVPGP